MRNLILLTVLPLATAATTMAGLITYDFNTGFVNGGNLPDGNVNPWSDTRAVSGTPGELITDISVRLTLAGGCNGDLYGYLSYNGTLVPLLNRVGLGSSDSFGYADAGLNVTFTDGAANNIHFYQSVGGYSIAGGAAWQPDGRAINPVTAAPSDFDAPGTATLLGAFSKMDPSGNWSLVLADVSAGGGQSQVLSWGLDITTASVPEPSTLAFAGLALAGLLIARRRQYSRLASSRGWR